jgi:endonuclease/exonuclease/phosphatase family metal-dependent hydrolase
MGAFSTALAMLAAASLSAAPTPRGCSPLRVMTYNIRLDLASDGPNRWSARRDQFIGQIAFVHPDILGLQEVVAGQKADLERRLPGYRFLGVARDDGKSAGEFSNLAIDRNAFRILSSGTFWLSPTPDRPSKGWDASYIRIATWAHLVGRKDGRRLLAVNTHLDNDGAVARREGARMIRDFVATHRKAGERVVVTGDFNSTPDSPPYRVMTGPPLSLKDSKLASINPPLGPDSSWNNFKLVPDDPQRIDFVFADPAMKVERYAVLAWHFDGPRTASDHYPVVADLIDCR